MNIIEKAILARKPEAREPEVAADNRPATGNRTPEPRTVGKVSLGALVGAGLLTIDVDDEATLSEFRHLKRSVLQCAFGPLAEKGANLVVVTSPLPGAGKSFLSAHLAQSLAMERDHSAVLIDADNTRATLSRALGLGGKDGLFEAFQRSEFSLETCTYDTDQAGLHFVPAGSHFPDSLELLTSLHTKTIFERVTHGDPNRVYVVDAPPLLGTPNAVALAALAGQILLVVEAGATGKSQVKAALELLNRDKPIGLVLNKIPHSPLLSMAGAHYHYYGPKHEQS